MKTQKKPRTISVCIPAYNRPDELVELLTSIAAQGMGDWDVVICEDRSPRGEEIAARVAEFAAAHPGLRINYFTNQKNLGYDGNLRSLLDRATGRYCLFMGDDDLMAPGALKATLAAVSHPDIGFVLRAWESVDKESGAVMETYRYFQEDRLFPPGPASIAALYRRSVFISGLTVERETARSFQTDRFDGMLLYQLYLVGRILTVKNGYYLSHVTAVRKVGGEHFFGTSEAEKGRFTPKALLPSHSVEFLKGLFVIADVLEREFCPAAGALIRSDLGRYSYPMLEIQAQHLSRKGLLGYAGKLARLGLGRSANFWLYLSALFTLGPGLSNRCIRGAKRLLGRTPNLGGSCGEAVT